jgi:hypothetical protein
MKNKINIAALLKKCPRGMELDCTVYNGKVCFEGIDDENAAYPIKISVNLVNIEYLDIWGQYSTRDYAQCVIFPKGKTTWEDFIPPCEFNDGDVVATATGSWIGITTGGANDTFIPTYCVIKIGGEFEAYFGKKEKWNFDRLATEEEKEKLFNVIQENGYKWDEVTKTLDKLVPNRFDVTTLKSFESRVLVRDKNTDEWRGHFFSHCDNNSDRPYVCIGTEGINEYKQCIPYNDNEHLLGTTNECDEYYKNW